MITRNYRSIQEFYENARVWSNIDRWHNQTEKKVSALIQNLVSKLSSVPPIVANLGSGGKTFNIPANLHIHIDLVRGRLLNKIGIVATVEQLPLKTSSVDLAVCVGSVINHGDGKLMLAEMERILRPGGLLVLEFDCSDGLHQTARSESIDFVPINTFFNGQMLRLVEYSRAFVENHLESAGLAIEYRHSFHIWSSLLLRFHIPPALASLLIRLDWSARLSRHLRYRGSNIFIIARKK